MSGSSKVRQDSALEQAMREERATFAEAFRLLTIWLTDFVTLCSLKYMRMDRSMAYVNLGAFFSFFEAVRAASQCMFSARKDHLISSFLDVHSKFHDAEKFFFDANIQFWLGRDIGLYSTSTTTGDGSVRDSLREQCLKTHQFMSSTFQRLLVKFRLVASPSDACMFYCAKCSRTSPQPLSVQSAGASSDTPVSEDDTHIDTDEDVTNVPVQYRTSGAAQVVTRRITRSMTKQAREDSATGLEPGERKTKRQRRA